MVQYAVPDRLPQASDLKGLGLWLMLLQWSPRPFKSPPEPQVTMQLMHSIDSSKNYNKVLHLETAVANEVLHHMDLNEGLHIPPDLVKGAYSWGPVCKVAGSDPRASTSSVLVCYQEHINGDQSVKLPAVTQEHQPQGRFKNQGTNPKYVGWKDVQKQLDFLAI
ncbi:hypothetical protein UY3_07181 [Chelonia mydas]|uniref:Uncharacterized protein n=1 Tax=Chelonia mydas TaxID=8469 RepID=M7BEP0_CHEMY|nr:hypothetical protein UY3_07181 [Chelonia mydas]